MLNITIFDKYYVNDKNSIDVYSVSSMCQMSVKAWNIKITKTQSLF